ncbi:DUF4097 family beta strand repeat-containing protein [Amycolatopsis jiangsuensis]|uniref:DUF4097 and DUF4098 domain-containing protein YvlB n=1 Tax=Amycolatopsis jiangsuensis TaxID=1181879 RepID=A0A840J0Z2_9PSEU|nr:DUF4097 family beta strand repeat-containing protein [Amycolatopsis jiangsuensis]MBB4687419.1 DUF4097 and DUF4098 domain-containing protein YvlB [Amycolatopsis jiangsuensis]
MARPLLALAGIVVIGAGVAIAFGWGLGSSVTREATVTQEIRGVKLASGSGDVRVRTGTGPVRVHEKLNYHFRSEPGDAYRVEGDQLVLGDCGHNCSADLEVVVPAGVPVTGDTDSGSLDIAGVGSVDVTGDSGRAKVTDVAGPVSLRLDSGSVDVRNVGDLKVHGGSGQVNADAVRGSVDITADSGRVEVGLAQPSDVKVQADSGSVQLSVPAGSYRVIGDSDSGHRSVLIPQYTQNPGPDAKTLDLNTSSGSLTVKAA